MIALLLAAGLAIGFAAARRAPRTDIRREAGVVLLVALALVPVARRGRAGVLRRAASAARSRTAGSS